jgi:L-rhamnose mutarotase
VTGALDEVLAASPFQNYSAYRWDSRLYTYFEYTGDQFDADYEQLLASKEFRSLQEALEPLSKNGSSPVAPMKPVFYLE